MITFDVEPVLWCRADMLVLLDEHYEELTLNKHVVKLNPNWDEYSRREIAGKFALITMRDDGKLIGYSAWFIDYHIHYRDLLVATNDVIFLKKEYRTGVNGIKLLKKSEEFVKKWNPHKITWHIKESNNFSPILKRMGYSTEDIILGKIC
jgi:hypothetical protein